MAVNFEKYFEYYISQSTSQDIEITLVESHNAMVTLINKLTEEQLMYRYEEGKWSVKDLIQHVIDVERVFVYRAVRFARNDKTNLQGFNEDYFADNANADRKTKDELLKEYVSVHRATIVFYNQLSINELEKTGTANKIEFSVFEIAHIIAGHIQHHLKVINKRYLNKNY